MSYKAKIYLKNLLFFLEKDIEEITETSLTLLLKLILLSEQVQK